MLGLTKGQRDVLVVSTLFKVLLFPAYRSTDFEVHRNWLAITHNLPLKQWYFDVGLKTSEWTLDYPPFFAYFSYALTLPAKLLPKRISQHILQLSSTPIEGWDVTGYMRCSVLLTELVLLWGAMRITKGSSDPNIARTISLAIALHPAFIILDSLHFQYNGFLFGLMLLSLAGAKERKPLMCAALFAALLNFKHIYVYLAGAWFVYLLRAYCMPRSGLSIRLDALARIGAVTAAIFAVSLAPFVYYGQIPQVLSRLFPFTRGLNHAYWAPNAWAGVTLLDRILLKATSRLGYDMPVSSAGIASTSRGLVGDTFFAVLPNVKPIHCFLLTGVSQVAQLMPLWREPSYRRFVQAIAACGFSSFMFGWHVHEKAVMLILMPLSLLAADDWNSYQAFLLASVSGVIGLFPLLFKAAETPVKFGYSLIWLLLVGTSLRKAVSRPEPTIANVVADGIQRLYLASAVPLLLFTSVVHPALTLSGRISSNAEFLPLMMTSVWCSIGLWMAWARLVVVMFTSPSGPEVKVD